MTILRVVDLECTGLDPAKDGAEPCEIGWTDVTQNGPGWHVGETFSTFTKPSKPIPPTASAVHHIVDDMVVSAPSWAAVCQELARDKRDLVYAAHKASFERLFLKMDIRWICTWKLAVHLAPKAPAYGLQVLRYWLKLDLDRERAMPPHRSGPDTYVTACLLARMLTKLSVEEAIDISSRPAILSRFPFGKHFDEPLAEVPSDYLRWILDQGKFDEDVQATCRHYIEARRKK